MGLALVIATFPKWLYFNFNFVIPSIQLRYNFIIPLEYFPRNKSMHFAPFSRELHFTVSHQIRFKCFESTKKRIVSTIWTAISITTKSIARALVQLICGFLHYSLSINVLQLLSYIHTHTHTVIVNWITMYFFFFHYITGLFNSTRIDFINCK